MKGTINAHIKIRAFKNAKRIKKPYIKNQPKEDIESASNGSGII